MPPLFPFFGLYGYSSHPICRRLVPVFTAAEQLANPGAGTAAQIGQVDTDCIQCRHHQHQDTAQPEMIQLLGQRREPSGGWQSVLSEFLL